MPCEFFLFSVGSQFFLRQSSPTGELFQFRHDTILNFGSTKLPKSSHGNLKCHYNFLFLTESKGRLDRNNTLRYTPTLLILSRKNSPESQVVQ